MAAASVVHSRIQANLAYELRKATDYAVYTELSLLINEKEYKPDVCEYAYKEIDWKHDVIKTEELPIISIEIVSPRQTIQDVVEKIDTYLEVGIQSCWLIVPYPRIVTVYNEQGEHTFTTEAILDKPLNIKIAINDMFR